MLRTPFNSSNRSYYNNQNRSERTYGNVKVIQNNRYDWGVEDIHGNIIVPYGKYAWIDGFDQGLARVRTEGQITYTKNIGAIYSINEESRFEEVTTDPELIHQIIIEDKQERPEVFAKWGIINEKGEEVLPVEYDEIWKFLGKNLSSTKVVKDGVDSIVYFDKLNPQPNYTGNGLSSPIIKGRRCYQPNHRNQNYRRPEREKDNLREETWWAMTDGMYGDYPGDVDDYDFLGF